VAQTLATTNVGLGLFMFSPSYSRFADLTIVWVYLAYSIFFVMLVAVLVTVFMILPRFNVNKDGCFSANKNETEKEEHPLINELPSLKTPTNDIRLRWIMLGLFLAVMLPSMITIIVLVALPLQ